MSNSIVLPAEETFNSFPASPAAPAYELGVSVSPTKSTEPVPLASPVAKPPDTYAVKADVSTVVLNASSEYSAKVVEVKTEEPMLKVPEIKGDEVKEEEVKSEELNESEFKEEAE